MLMQFWKDETTPFQYGGIVRHDSKVLLYVMFQLKAVLKTVDFKFSSLCSQGNDHLERLHQGGNSPVNR